MAPRHNLLVNDVTMDEQACKGCLLGTHMVSEGTSFAMYENRCFPGLSDTPTRGTVKISVPADAKFDLHKKMLLWNVKDPLWDDCLSTFAWEIDKDTLMLLVHMPDFSRIHVLETFSGGYAGWKHATRFLSDVFWKIHADDWH